ncbi:MAG: hypothetical protein J0L58_10680 [Burkholderiales bacterium]|nr:hypothetical protein [Burkholderiales bacterium]
MSVAQRQRSALAADKATGAVTEAARQSFDHLLQRAWRAGMVPEGATVEIAPIASLPPKMKEKHAIVLTIAGYGMRLLVTLYFKLDADTRAHFEQLNRVEPGTMSEQAFLDALAECGNICAGAFNRYLGDHFPHIGMSTPNLLSRESMAYVDSLGRSLPRHFEMRGLAQTYWASLFIVAYNDLNFAVRIEAEAETADDTGELEMF